MYIYIYIFIINVDEIMCYIIKLIFIALLFSFLVFYFVFLWSFTKFVFWEFLEILAADG